LCKRAARQSVIVIPVLVGTAAGTHRLNARIVATLFLKAIKVLFITELQGVAPDQLREGYGTVRVLVYERVKLKPAHLAIASNIGSRRNLRSHALWIAHEQRIKSPLGCINARITGGAISRQAQG